MCNRYLTHVDFYAAWMEVPAPVSLSLTLVDVGTLFDLFFGIFRWLVSKSEYKLMQIYIKINFSRFIMIYLIWD